MSHINISHDITKHFFVDTFSNTQSQSQLMGPLFPEDVQTHSFAAEKMRQDVALLPVTQVNCPMVKGG